MGTEIIYVWPQGTTRIILFDQIVSFQITVTVQNKSYVYYKKNNNNNNNKVWLYKYFMHSSLDFLNKFKYYNILN